MSKTKGKRTSEIKMIPVDRINILNPRARSQKIFGDITTNMTKVGLKRPITVTRCNSKISNKDYDLVCGQGRVEAFVACGQTHIPAIIIDASEQQALIMSLVENLARRHHRATDLLQALEILRKQKYDAPAIARKTGLVLDYVQGIMHLMDHGEERLLTAVEAGHMPISLAIRVAENPANEQRALQEAYESNQLRGNRLLLAKKLLDRRKRDGKTIERDPRRGRDKPIKSLSSQDVMKVYNREVSRKQLLTRKSNVVQNRLLFIKEALSELLQDENFNNLLRAEGLFTLPKPLAGLMREKGNLHG